MSQEVRISGLVVIINISPIAFNESTFAVLDNSKLIHYKDESQTKTIKEITFDHIKDVIENVEDQTITLVLKKHQHKIKPVDQLDKWLKELQNVKKTKKNPQNKEFYLLFPKTKTSQLKHTQSFQDQRSPSQKQTRPSLQTQSSTLKVEQPLKKSQLSQSQSQPSTLRSQSQPLGKITRNFNTEKQLNRHSSSIHEEYSAALIQKIWRGFYVRKVWAPKYQKAVVQIHAIRVIHILTVSPPS
ncbi:MAG: hypothetical protein EZS28_040175, partial [Streblomastix strix]